MAPGKYARHNRRQAKRDSARAAGVNNHTPWIPSADIDTEEVESRWLETESVRVIQRVVKEVHTGRVVDYALMHEIFIDGKWEQIARIDCCDGEVHKHWPPPYKNGELRRILIRKIVTQDDIEATFGASVNEIYNNLELNESWWRDGSSI